MNDMMPAPKTMPVITRRKLRTMIKPDEEK
jgi:hypothetical protein